MTDLGPLLDDLVQKRKVDAADADLAFSIARFWRQHGTLTKPMAASAWALLVDHGVDPGVDRPADDDGELEPLVAAVAASPLAELKRRSDVRFTIEGDLIVGHTPFALKELCKSVPGRRWDGARKKWVWPKGPIAAETLRSAFADYDPEWGDGFDALLGDLDRAAAHKTATDLPDIAAVKTTAWMHQRQGFHFVSELEAGALWMDMGTGKSLIAVARTMEIGGNHLIACPDKVVGVWPREFRRHARGEVHFENGLRHKKRGLGFNKLSVRERMEAFEELRNCDCGRPHLFIVNYEALATQPLATWAANRNWDQFIMDEAHRIKSPTGVQSMTAAKIAKRSGYRLQLTGTPMPHSPLDVFAQYRALDQAIFGASFTAHRNRYAIMGGYEGKEVLGMNPEHLDELHEKCYRFAFRVKADDVLDLPALLDDQYLSVTMSGAQAKAYTDMQNELAAEFPGISVEEMAVRMVQGESVAPNAMVGMLRLRQITGGGLKDDISGRTVVLGDAKRKLLKEWMADFPADEPLVVFAEFTHDVGVIREVAEELGRRHGEVSGRRNDLTADSEFPPDLDVMAVQIASGGSGVDLTRACYGCYYSVGYNNGDYRQSRKRLHRPGQTRPVRFWHLLAEDTIDTKVYETLEERQETSDLVQEPRR